MPNNDYTGTELPVEFPLGLTWLKFDEWCQISAEQYTQSYRQITGYAFPRPSADEQERFWQEVTSGRHIMLGIKHLNEGRLIGAIGFFNFSPGRCETHAIVVPITNLGQGYAGKAYQLALPYIARQKALTQVDVLLHPDNKAAATMYNRLGFTLIGTVEDEEFAWDLYSYNLVSGGNRA